MGAGAASGTITLPDETSFTFEVESATGIAGLYDATVFPDGRIRGTSERGARLEGRTTRQRRGGLLVQRNTITPPDGEPQTVSARVTDPGLLKGPIGTRVIVLADGRAKGNPKRVPVTQFVSDIFG